MEEMKIVNKFVYDHTVNRPSFCSGR